MISLKSRLSRTPIVTEDPMDVMLPPMVTATLPGSYDVNVLLVVREHAPRRIKEIEKELAELQSRIAKISDEAQTLQRIVNALDA